MKEDPVVETSLDVQIAMLSKDLRKRVKGEAEALVDFYFDKANPIFNDGDIITIRICKMRLGSK